MLEFKTFEFKPEPKYEILPPNQEYEFGIFKILEGKYEGLMYGYGDIKLEDHPDGSGDGQLKFEPVFFNLPEDYDKTKLDDPELAEIMGNIIYNVLIYEINKHEISR